MLAAKTRRELEILIENWNTRKLDSYALWLKIDKTLLQNDKKVDH